MCVGEGGGEMCGCRVCESGCLVGGGGGGEVR